MIGSSNNDNKVIQQWYQIFKSRKNKPSLYAQHHWQKLICLGIPNINDEDWKNLSLESFFKQKFILPTINKILIDQVNKHSFALNAIRLVFVNGHFQPEMSSSNTDLFTIKHSLEGNTKKLPKSIKSEPFLHLTESLAEEITFIHLPHGNIVSRPLYLLHITCGQSNGLNTVHYRHHIELEENAKAKIIEHYVTLGNMPHFTGARLTSNIANNAYLNHIKITFEEHDSYHFSHNDIIINRNAQVNSTSFLIGSKRLRHNTSVQMNGEKSKLYLKSLVIPSHSEIADIRSYLEHNQIDCLTRQLHKAIVCDKGRAVFNGHIKVSQNSFKTDSKMTNNNLLIGNLAEIYTKPQLEIYADDVKCGHGATVGCINNEQIFYLRTRGIYEKEAQQIIINAFAADLMANLEDNTIRHGILQRINSYIFGVKTWNSI
ncbi:Fe-S cluster assembly protein SufD [Pantoea sp. Mhis]|uniref:Fe-S cluster assembly protein SufD n=1 Tax=Pantoea sp. Mhis TaxID=2576759 RepID=UPI00135A0910|nr:Fe-S cluster assembly protein SufD [Pantoea sp. Mhis]MXP56212.1 Fe-S cluster assembly protein SufD [Pantoea sp. Mhis]